MNEQELMAQINELKIKVKEVVLQIQGLKGQLEQSTITLEEFKAQKSILEEELRDILEEISEIKERSGFKIERRVTVEPTHFEAIATEEKIKTSELIDKEIQIAGEAKDLMYYFQTDFEDSISKVKVYLSITLEDHFIVGIDFTDYPECPKLEIPPKVLQLFKNSSEGFYASLSSYSNWDTENPGRIYELATEIETVLINVYSADIDSILKKSVEYVSQAKDELEKLIKYLTVAANNKNYERAIELCYSIIDKAYEVQDYDTANTYTKKLNEFIKKSR
jgi:hypothetical protein